MNNLTINFDENGRTITNDEELNKVIKEVENETGALLGVVTSGISYEDNADEKRYLLLLSFYPENSNADEFRDWMIKTGRQEVYNYLKEMVESELIDPNTSFILPCDSIENSKKDDVTFNAKAITVFRFMKVMVENKKVLDDERFSIDEYSSYQEDLTIVEV